MTSVQDWEGSQNPSHRLAPSLNKCLLSPTPSQYSPPSRLWRGRDPPSEHSVLCSLSCSDHRADSGAHAKVLRAGLRGQAGTYFTESIDLTILEMEFLLSSATGVQQGQGQPLLLAYSNLSHPATLFTALVGIRHEFTPHKPL